MYGIDYPEKRQPFGNRAKQCTSKLVFGKFVEVDEEVIEEGLAWVDRPYCELAVCNHRRDNLEFKDRSGKRGLWRDTGEIPPWEFRRIR